MDVDASCRAPHLRVARTHNLRRSCGRRERTCTPHHTLQTVGKHCGADVDCGGCGGLGIAQRSTARAPAAVETIRSCLVFASRQQQPAEASVRSGERCSAQTCGQRSLPGIAVCVCVCACV
ncbi:hypothetical protein CHLRE_03g198851v5 [Chlamydomonas reinhardtii]|uniref:Uncharacterized protein n=1 Tax=Chlamydomonas reinhardtii TaxID=3055 RepID=A0A2K3DZH2_CHLRE|nr:uncharacterized protein CHLRE_03g198851v5 [Chlamydomonas reinhardtii]PNW85946.1 hypothetical protein CHLRE_03g198851v5 [Chlamydomonas reinhardtii]